MSTADESVPHRLPSPADALIAVGVLVVLIVASFLLFGDDAILAPTQVALTLAATLAAGIAWKSGHAWDDIRQAAVDGSDERLTADWHRLTLAWAPGGRRR
jgi:hypothetical protein